MEPCPCMGPIPQMPEIQILGSPSRSPDPARVPRRGAGGLGVTEGGIEGATHPREVASGGENPEHTECVAEVCKSSCACKAQAYTCTEFYALACVHSDPCMIACMARRGTQLRTYHPHKRQACCKVKLNARSLPVMRRICGLARQETGLCMKCSLVINPHALPQAQAHLRM